MAMRRLKEFWAFPPFYAGGPPVHRHLYGVLVASHPVRFIMVSLAIVCASAWMAHDLQEEKSAEKLWISPDSHFVRGSQWLSEHFPNTVRPDFLLIVGEDVLQPKFLKEMLYLYRNISESNFKDQSFSDVCSRVPELKDAEKMKRHGGTGAYIRMLLFQWKYRHLDLQSEDPSLTIGREEYCYWIEDMPTSCLSRNLLKFFDFDEDVIGNLSRKSILQTIRDVSHLEIKQNWTMLGSISDVLGGIERDSSGNITGARATRMLWFTEVNQSAVTSEDRNINLPQNYVSNKDVSDWEDGFLDFCSKYHLEGFQTYFYSMRSFLIIAVKSVLDDLNVLLIGYALVFLFVIGVLGKRNCVENRWLLSIAGLISIGFSTMTALGTCYQLGFVYGSMHRTMPFILLGIGIDDMFVIVQAFDNLPSVIDVPLKQRIGMAMRHAGMAITMTSLTDFLAFTIGATTVIPALRSFCIYAAVGIVALYAFQCAFFLACFALDQRRIEEQRNGIIFCMRKPTQSACAAQSTCSKIDLLEFYFRQVHSKILLKPWIKVLVCSFTTVLVAVSIFFFACLEQRFDRMWLLPEDSYLYQYFMTSQQYFPSHWEMGSVLIGAVNYTKELPNIVRLVGKIRADPAIASVSSWTDDFVPYYNTFHENNFPVVQNFSSILSLFLVSPTGYRYRRQFRVDGELQCEQPSPSVLASRIDFEFRSMQGPKQHIPAMNRINSLVDNSGITSGDGFTLAWAENYGNWEVDEIIQVELYRNLVLAVFCVFVVTLSFLASIRACLLVFLCVTLTLVSVGGLMYVWGLTVDTFSCICLVLAVGLSVDYSCHIGHCFMVLEGSREERAREALGQIGPAVFCGGFTTFLAFAGLATSQSHIFKTFFKVFFGVVLFGLYYSLFLLPVLLSVIGPAPYQHLDTKYVKDKKEVNGNIPHPDSPVYIEVQKSEVMTMSQKETGDTESSRL